jgi:molybdate transport system ATP-binding protein
VFASPRNARVAELVGIQNHFQGQFFSGANTGANAGGLAGGFGRLVWHGQALEAGESVSLQVTDKGRLDNGAQVSWVIAGELLDVTTEAGSPQALNTIECIVLEVLPLGEISLCTVAPKQLQHQRVALNLPAALLRQLAVQAGTTLYLHIPPEAVHIMPVRQG